MGGEKNMTANSRNYDWDDIGYWPTCQSLRTPLLNGRWQLPLNFIKIRPLSFQWSFSSISAWHCRHHDWTLNGFPYITTFKQPSLLVRYNFASRIPHPTYPSSSASKENHILSKTPGPYLHHDQPHLSSTKTPCKQSHTPHLPHINTI